MRPGSYDEGTDASAGQETATAWLVEIAEAFADLHHRFHGVAPVRLSAFCDGSALTVVMSGVLTKVEHELVAMGREEGVVASRHGLSSRLRPDFLATLERITDWRGTSFLSALDPQADVASITLTLGPTAAIPVTSVRQASSDHRRLARQRARETREEAAAVRAQAAQLARRRTRPASG